MTSAITTSAPIAIPDIDPGPKDLFVSVESEKGIVVFPAVAL